MLVDGVVVHWLNLAVALYYPAAMEKRLAAGAIQVKGPEGDQISISFSDLVVLWVLGGHKFDVRQVGIFYEVNDRLAVAAE